MPGKTSNHCDFSDCEYRRFEEGYSGAQFQQPPNIIGTSDTTEWMLYFVSGYNDFEIWDINPLPQGGKAMSISVREKQKEQE